MALNVGRKMTEQDTEKLQAAAERFCKKHKIDTDGFASALDMVDSAIETAAYPELKQAMSADWKRRVKRALGGYTSWGWGYVGYYAK